MDDYEEGYRHAREAVFYHTKDLRINWRGKATLLPLYGDPRKRMSLDNFIREEVSYRYNKPSNEWSLEFQRGIQAGTKRSLAAIGSILEEPHLFGQTAREALSPEYSLEKIGRMRDHPILHRLGLLRLAEALQL